jgi:2-isopropylmalate synthase
MPGTPADWVVDPQVISATELRHHRHGPGERYVLVDDRFVRGAGQYCIARRIPRLADYGAGHVDIHVHDCDSLFIFLGDEDGYRGLRVEVSLGGRVFAADSPTSVFVPAGVPHGYRVLGGAGTYLNHVLAGDYNASLLDPPGERS